jgi:hypothetical protein
MRYRFYDVLYFVVSVVLKWFCELRFFSIQRRHVAESSGPPEREKMKGKLKMYY